MPSFLDGGIDFILNLKMDAMETNFKTNVRK